MKEKFYKSEKTFKENPSFLFNTRLPISGTNYSVNKWYRQETLNTAEIRTQWNPKRKTTVLFHIYTTRLLWRLYECGFKSGPMFRPLWSSAQWSISLWSSHGLLSLWYFFNKSKHHSSHHLPFSSSILLLHPLRPPPCPVSYFLLPPEASASLFLLRVFEPHIPSLSYMFATLREEKCSQDTTIKQYLMVIWNTGVVHFGEQSFIG